MKTVLMIFFAMLLFSGICCASDISELQAKQFQTNRLVESIPENAEPYMKGVRPDETEDFFSRAWQIVKDAIKNQSHLWKVSGKSSARIMAVVAICTCVSLLFEKQGEKISAVAGILAISSFCFSDVTSFMGIGEQTMQELSDFSAVLIPVMTAAATASGTAATAAAAASGTFVFLKMLFWMFRNILTPVIYACVAFSVTTGITEQAVFSRLEKTLSGLLKTGLKLFMFLFSAWLSVTGIISGSVDSLTLKATKLTASAFVPVVGGMVSDASETILVSAGMLKNSIGVFGMLSVLSIIIVPFLKMAVPYLMLQVTGFFASAFGMKAHSDVIQAVLNGMGNLMGIVILCSLMLFLACICIMKVTVL